MGKMGEGVWMDYAGRVWKRVIAKKRHTCANCTSTMPAAAYIWRRVVTGAPERLCNACVLSQKVGLVAAELLGKLRDELDNLLLDWRERLVAGQDPEHVLRRCREELDEVVKFHDVPVKGGGG